tara:strand:- start:116 stop:646 length:531 start_codon:yes stop_codon:yes gene_type:complete
MAFDKITAMAAPAGHSLTNAPGQWAWDSPPQIADPNDAIDFVIDKLEDQQTHESMMKMLLAGITIEELVSQISFKGFMQGFFNPDVAELIKPAIAIYLYDQADKNGIEPQVYMDRNPEGEELDDVSFFKILKDRNPKLYSGMLEQIKEDHRMEEQRAVSSVEKDAQLDNSFIRAGE